MARLVGFRQNRRAASFAVVSAPLATDRLKADAHELGFAFCGVARAEFMEPEARQLEAWLNGGHHGAMDYMANHFDKRVDPTKLVPGARTVIVLGYNYFPPDDTASREVPKVARYAYGEDYHFVVKRRGKELLKRLRARHGEGVVGRVFVDSAPVLERQWAQRAGQGWLGKNTLLLRRDAGSYFFLCEVIVDLEFAPDPPVGDFCGTCRRCIDACPTDAIADQGYLLDARRCISYLTIELREAMDAELGTRLDGWAFGCDVCQEVCPWNRFAEPHDEPAFLPSPELAGMGDAEWRALTEETFRQVFRRSPLKRRGHAGLQHTLRWLGGQNEQAPPPPGAREGDADATGP